MYREVVIRTPRKTCRFRGCVSCFYTGLHRDWSVVFPVNDFYILIFVLPSYTRTNWSRSLQVLSLRSGQKRSRKDVCYRFHGIRN